MALTPTRTMARRSPLRPLQRMSTGRAPTNRLHNIFRNGLDASDMSDDDTPHNISFDEQIIQLRGALRSSPRRRSAALATAEMSLLGLSPDTSFDTSFGSNVSNLSTFSNLSSSTPVREPVLAEGIRKRLMLTPPSDLDTSFPKGPTPPKRRKIKQSSTSASWRRRLSALSHDQLIVLVDEVTMKHPNIHEEVERMMPSPDINPFIDNLEYFRRNIFKSLPHSRLGSSRDAFCFKRVKTHVENFKAACINQGKQLTEAEAWEVSIEYVIRAAELVDRLPDWDNPTHNKIKSQCFKGLLSQCKSALKHSDLDKAKYQSIWDRLQTVVKMCLDFDPLLHFVEKKLLKLMK